MDNKEASCAPGSVVIGSDVRAESIPRTEASCEKRKPPKWLRPVIKAVLAAAILIGGYFLMGYLMDLGTLYDSYTFTEVDGGYEISEFSRNRYSVKFTELKLPAKHRGKPVIAIGDAAFAGCRHLVSVTVPDSVTVIGRHAFSHCESLDSMLLPDGLTHIGSWAFSNCESLTSTELPCDMVDIGDYAFAGCTSMESISIPDGVTSIGNHAFSYCHNLQSADIPDSVERIGTSAFSYCRSLSSVSIPAAAELGETAFNHCDALTAIDVHPDNPSYCSQDGVLFSKDMTRLLTYPSGKESAEYTVPDSVTAIHSRAFVETNRLRRITIPDSITDVGEILPFCECTALEAIIVSENHPVYSSLDGVLLSRDRSRLICYPSGRPADHYDIPQGITSIAPFAFTYGYALRSVTIPEGVTELGADVFFSCENIEQVRLPESMTKIDELAFVYMHGKITVIAPHEAEYYGYGSTSIVDWVVEPESH